MINWLKEYPRQYWTGHNPFDGLMKINATRFKPQMPATSIITDAEMERMLEVAQDKKLKSARIFINVARMTPFRPDEIQGNKKRDVPGLSTAPEFLEKEYYRWMVEVTKTRGTRYYRKIAIPPQLVAFLEKEGVDGMLPEHLKGLRKQFDKVRKLANVPHITPKTFRKDFTNRMRRVGAPKEIRDLHAGRRDSSVREGHYETDLNENAEICREWVMKMFPPVKGVVLKKPDESSS